MRASDRVVGMLKVADSDPRSSATNHNDDRAALPNRERQVCSARRNIPVTLRMEPDPGTVF
jgi:hypothetical protein